MSWISRQYGGLKTGEWLGPEGGNQLLEVYLEGGN